MSNTKIPFLIVKNFISSLLCERIINDLNILRIRPMIGQDGMPKRMIFANKLNQMRLASHLDSIIDSMESHFECEYFGTHSIQFEWYPQNSKAMPAASDGYRYGESGWQRYKEVDLTGILWLTDSNENDEYFDPTFEAYGGKLAFPNFDMSLIAERGTLTVFPSSPNFVHTVGSVEAGNMCVARLSIRTAIPYEYDESKFNTNIDTWNI